MYIETKKPKMSLKISKAPENALFPAAGSKTNRNKCFVSDNAKTSFGCFESKLLRLAGTYILPKPHV